MPVNQTQRPKFYENQYLGAEDLTAAVDYSRIQDARHALGGHTWGIALGLEIVERERPGGAIDVYVTPGYAWDGFGRPIVMLEPTPLGAQLFQSYSFQQGLDDKDPEGRPFTVCIAYDEQPVGGPLPGFEACDVNDQNRRIEERFKLEVTEFRLPLPPPPPVRVTHDDVSVAGQSVVPQDALNAPKVPTLSGAASSPLVNQIYDESIPFQIFPVPGERKRWPIPIGVVRWQPAHGNLPGRFISRSNPDDLVSHRQARRNIGVVAESVQATDGHIRIKDRKKDNSSQWSDDLAWIEGKLRVEGDASLFGGKLAFRDTNGQDLAVPLQMQRVGDPGSGASALQVGIGSVSQTNNRFAVGPLKTNGEVDEKLVVLSGGNVGLGTTAPEHKLEIHGVDNSLVILSTATSGKDRNAGLELRTTAGNGVAYIDFTRGSTSTAGSGTPDYSARISYNEANTGAIAILSGGNVGIGTMNPAGKLTIESSDDINVILANTAPAAEKHMTLTVGTAGSGIHFSKGNRFFISADAYADRNTTGFGNELFTLLPSGNVGLGTTSPSGKVDVDESESRIGSRLKIGHTTPGYAHHITSFRDMVLNSKNGFYIRHNDTPGDPSSTSKELVSITKEGKVGIGMPALTEPTETLDVRGNIKLHTDGSLFAPGCVQNLRIIVGHVGADGTLPLEEQEYGYAPAQNSTGIYTVKFRAPFAGRPVVVVSPVNPIGDNLLTINNLTVGEFQVVARRMLPPDEGTPQDTAFTFVAMGLRV